MNISIYGTGYVGLVSGACLADLGHHVTCFDIDNEKITLLKQGRSPIYEENLEQIIKKNLDEQRITFTSSFDTAVDQGELHLICVGTPSLEDGSADLSAVISVATKIAEYANDDTIIVTKSTVPVGTGALIQKTVNEVLVENKKEHSIHVASNPEFLREGVACCDFLQADRVIIGANIQQAETALLNLYAPLKNKGVPVISMSIESAELTKYASNAMLATKISFINQMSQIADAVGANIEEISFGMGLDKRIGPHFIQAGCGYGGSCFPKDIRALKHIALNNNVDTTLIDAVEDVNHQQKQKLFSFISQHFNHDLTNKKIALWGLSFKPGTDDLREASSLSLIESLTKAGANIICFDPVAMKKAQQLLQSNPAVNFKSSALETLEDADALAIVTEWKQFKDFPMTTLKQKMGLKPIFDGRNIYELSVVSENELNYYSIGRPKQTHGVLHESD